MRLLNLLGMAITDLRTAGSVRVANRLERMIAGK